MFRWRASGTGCSRCLEHKPWAPEDGQDWVAAFTWRGEPANFDEAELTVSPDLAVQLPAPGRRGGAR